MEVEIGDRLFDKLAGAAVVVKDGVVIEVREAPETEEAGRREGEEASA